MPSAGHVDHQRQLGQFLFAYLLDLLVHGSLPSATGSTVGDGESRRRHGTHGPDVITRCGRTITLRGHEGRNQRGFTSPGQRRSFASGPARMSGRTLRPGVSDRPPAPRAPARLRCPPQSGGGWKTLCRTWQPVLSGHDLSGRRGFGPSHGRGPAPVRTAHATAAEHPTGTHDPVGRGVPLWDRTSVFGRTSAAPAPAPAPCVSWPDQLRPLPSHTATNGQPTVKQAEMPLLESSRPPAMMSRHPAVEDRQPRTRQGAELPLPAPGSPPPGSPPARSRPGPPAQLAPATLRATGPLPYRPRATADSQRPTPRRRPWTRRTARPAGRPPPTTTGRPR